jgi:hypothetical protein
MNEIKIRETWAAMGRRLIVAFPLWVLKRLDSRSEGKGFAIKAIPFVIMFLSVASIANLAGRAYIHHENFSAYMTGAGIAVLVPIAVIAAMIVEGRWAWAFWAMAVVFAAISGTIQYNIYLLPGSGAMGIAEAIAFGYGVPLSEVMLAIMEARLVIQHENKKAAEAAALVAQQAEAAALAEQRAEQERQRMEQERQRAIAERQEAEQRQRQARIDAENHEFERQRKQAELEAYRVELAQKAELERERAMADLRIKEQKAASKTASKPATESATSQKPAERSQSTSYNDQMAMLTIYQSEPTLSDEKMAARIGKSKKTIQDLLADLSAKEVVHIEKVGRGKTVAVNGKFAAFKAGEI